MNKEQFKLKLIKAKHVIADTEANRNIELIEAFYNYYDDIAYDVFEGFSENRIFSHGFKLYVQQVLDMIHELDVTTEARNKKEAEQFSEHKAIGNVVSFSNFRKKRYGISANGYRSINTS